MATSKLMVKLLWISCGILLSVSGFLVSNFFYTTSATNELIIKMAVRDSMEFRSINTNIVDLKYDIKEIKQKLDK